MRLMAFAGLSDPIRAQTKTVTRRRGRRWARLRPGDLVQAVERGQFVPAAQLRRLAVLRVIAVRQERLDAITPEEVEREGCAGMDVPGFIAMFCAAFGGRPEDDVIRIEFTYAAHDTGSPP